MAGGDVHNPKLDNKGRPETDIRVVVNRPTPAGKNPYDDLDSVIILDPSQVEGD